MAGIVFMGWSSYVSAESASMPTDRLLFIDTKGAKIGLLHRFILGEVQTVQFAWVNIERAGMGQTNKKALTYV